MSGGLEGGEPGQLESIGLLLLLLMGNRLEWDIVVGSREIVEGSSRGQSPGVALQIWIGALEFGREWSFVFESVQGEKGGRRWVSGLLLV